MSSKTERNRLTPKLISLAVASCFATGAALANPTGPTVVNGQVTINPAGNLLSITNSPNAIINWNGFSISAGEITRFIQQNPSSAVLNRVVGGVRSDILGALQSRMLDGVTTGGRVFLINPSGIVFGAGSQIDVGGLVASTLALSNEDFLGGRLRFAAEPGAGSVINNGAINTATGGQVYLVGTSVTNNGIITSPKGEVILAAGNSVELVNPGTPNLRVEITAPDNEARNLGSIVAEAGRVGIYAGLIHHGGTTRADSAMATEDGRIVLRATKNTTIDAGSIISANGPSGGQVTIQSGDTTLVGGAISATGSAGKGGTVQVLGNLVGLVDNAAIDASGQTGGGTILIGGDHRGQNASVQNAFATYFGPDARARADAITRGDGGRVIVWSNEATRVYGGISARGGALSGNGGLVETSGHYLEVTRTPDVRAPNGTGGLWLLDPAISITLVAGGGTVNNDGAPNFTPNASGSQIGSDLIRDQLNTGGSVTLDTTGAGSDAGDIIVSAGAGFTTTPAAPVTLTMKAHNDIIINDSIQQLAGSPLSLVLTADQDASGAGSVTITPTTVPVTINVGGNITVSGVDFNVLGGNNRPVSVTARGDLIVGQIAGNPLPLTGTMKVVGGTANGTNDASASLHANGNVSIKADRIEVRGGTASAFGSSEGGNDTANANGRLSAGGMMTLAALNNGILVAGGTANADARDAAEGTASANALVSAGTGMSVTVTAGGMTIRGGAATASASGDGIASANVTATVTSANGDVNVVVSGGGLTVAGGNNAFATASCCGGTTTKALADASALLAAPGGNMTLSITGGMVVAGGDNARIFASYAVFSLVRALARAQVAAGGSLTVLVTSGGLTVRGGDNARASFSDSGGGMARIDVGASLTAGSTVRLGTGANPIVGGILVRGGNSARGSASSSGGRPAFHDVVVDTNARVAGTDVEINVTGTTACGTGAAGLCVSGGNNAGAFASEGSARKVTVNANAELVATNNLTIVAPAGVIVRGGGSAEASASSAGAGRMNQAATNASALVSAGGQLSITAGGLTVRGGDFASAQASSSGINNATVKANATVQGGSVALVIGSGGVTIQGGDSAFASASYGPSTGPATRNTATVEANAKVEATGGTLSLTITGGDLNVRGGDGAFAEASEAYGIQLASVSARGDLASAGDMSITITGGSVLVRGGDFAGANASVSSAAAAATALTDVRGRILAGGNLDIAVPGSVQVRGGTGAQASASGGAVNATTVASVNADASIGAGAALNIRASSLDVAGGEGGEAFASDQGVNTALTTANAMVAAGGTVTLAVTGPIAIAGGFNSIASASGSAGQTNSATVSAGALVSSGGPMIIVDAGSLSILGGDHGPGSGAQVCGAGVNFASVLTDASLLSGADFSYSGGSFTISGGTARTLGGVGSAGAAKATSDAGVGVFGTKTMNIAGDLVITGGMAFDDGLDATNGIAQARAILDPAAMKITTTGDISISGGTATGNGSAFAAVMAGGIADIVIGGSTGLTLTGGPTGPIGTSILADPSSPITITYTGGGRQNIVADATRDGAFIRTFLDRFLDLPPPAASPPPPPAGDAPPADVNLTVQSLERANVLDSPPIQEPSGEPPGDGKEKKGRAECR